MARSFANSKALSSLLQNQISKALTASRGYAATATGSVAARRGGGASSAIRSKKSSSSGEEKGEKVSWVPDPVTGYYKPENIKEIDVAELRASLLNKK
ncbi:hypothetical protein HN51_039256 [Arachis hypogaea]|uniref:Late embryogenesis abundant protein group 6 protein n=2 Tax=Arachis TaxID=3817 RepID=E5FHZ3_ARAHY|nr:indole-3-acetic acid-induced protein ARG2 [Arachis duranensis]XP_016205207.1 indole-3-acetic acid-induced protein ARG2 [Arachis ipaensis]XP_025604049.1 indole-3-acetic acid-induced protein ARG2 [Arachis hypogaea]XP_025660896.1 indole-3-acetic acid-induced protein ARG2 [Arachis hypogaea]XP_057721969.1 indole-3-acetic acid-induced protein ARG2-like [Arachis stenosperma]ADQ91844.1 late embryogenesis abundant protein group 6 protein [Arachis hypogaea]QHN84746.1 Indole-3-acetic acid-induced pro